MANTSLSPVPFQTPVTGSQGILTAPWVGWFRQLFQTVLTASQIDATTAAADASASAAAAASSAAVAGSNETSAASFTAQAGISATASANSATASAISATSAQSAADSAITLANQLGAGAVSPDYLTFTFSVPVHRQLVTFQRITLGTGGSLQISGRGRIL